MKVGYKTSTESEYTSLSISDTELAPVLVSVSQHKDKNMENRFIVWHIEGGLGKNVAATSLITPLVKKHKDRKLVIVASYPEIFLNHPDIWRVYRIGNTPYFYDDYILGKDTLVFRHEPYFQTSHILKKKHLIENWMDLLGIESTPLPIPDLKMNMVQAGNKNMWAREKPICVIQSSGGPFNQEVFYSWTRDMPTDLLLYLVERYKGSHHIIQITRPNGPKLPDVEVVDYPMTSFELFSLLLASDKRLLIDSCLQHAAAAFTLPSVVFWIGTSPENFGYKLHKNVKALPPKGNVKLVDAYLFDASFEGIAHECPYNGIEEMFDINVINNVIESY